MNSINDLIIGADDKKKYISNPVFIPTIKESFTMHPKKVKNPVFNYRPYGKE